MSDSRYFPVSGWARGARHHYAHFYRHSLSLCGREAPHELVTGTHTPCPKCLEKKRNRYEKHQRPA